MSDLYIPEHSGERLASLRPSELCQLLQMRVDAYKTVCLKYDPPVPANQLSSVDGIVEILNAMAGYRVHPNCRETFNIKITLIERDKLWKPSTLSAR